ncbi:MAG: M13 family metallopeptidase, partial [Prevotellaceae bacterium]|nr:M13 family metallopeptidase [Prevotellaceae bacterium]
MAILSGCGSGNAGINPANLDVATTPQQNFYQYACGGWMAQNPLRPEFARYGTFDQLRENNQQQLNDLIAELSNGKNDAGSVQQKIADLYNVGMDEPTLEALGNEPIQDELQAINGID